MDTIYDLEVSKEDEMVLRNNWKLISTSQFINLFKNALKLKETVTPYDLEQSLLRPQHDPLCAELMSRLLHKKNIKKGPDGNIISTTSDNCQTLDYDTWNMMLAKRFSMWFKNYRKFSMKYLGKDPVVGDNAFGKVLPHQADMPMKDQEEEIKGEEEKKESEITENKVEMVD